MTDEEQWLSTCLRQQRERAAWRAMLEPDDRVREWRGKTKSTRFGWMIYAAALFVALGSVVVYYS